MSAAQVTVAVVSWNTRDLLARCLESLSPEFEAGRVEVWVVDNASTDGSVELVQERFQWARLIASSENLGFGRAVNLVAGQTSSEWLAPANADVMLRPGALDALLEAGSGDPGAGAIAPRLLLPDGSVQHSVNGFPTLPFVLVQSFGLYHLIPSLGDRFALPGWWDWKRARRVPWAVGAFLLVRRAAWDQVGGFDERQWMYAEDVDLGWRLREAGWATRYEPRAVVDHVRGAATIQLFGPVVEPLWQRSTYGFIARRRGVGFVWTVALINFLGTALRWAKVLPRSLKQPDLYRDLRRAHARWALVHLKHLRRRSKLEAIE
jgi:N-acetylglucosaminyl-diphospho-decaprenol L-rhamnosyltransferase